MPNTVIERRFGRRVAVGLPALNEADSIIDCVAALLDQTYACAPKPKLSVHVLANNCRDGTADILRARFGGHPALEIREVSLLPRFAHAGAARRMAMDMAADALRHPDDVLLSTDADTIVAHDWLARTLDYFDAGYDAVAGRAILRSRELACLRDEQRDRLLALSKYQVLLSYLKRFRSDAGDAWPNHGYEGGASLALTNRMYAAIGGCPIIPVGEDRALFAAVRQAGGGIRHATNVKVYTSGRLDGRASGGMADTIRHWCVQSGADAIHETWPLAVELGHISKAESAPLTFDELPVELARARILANASRSSERLEMTA
jgi:cellulose synthase/poly-beta-1,6-N-acetylglucosamine synthase-like glycosyltransferase